MPEDCSPPANRHPTTSNKSSVRAITRALRVLSLMNQQEMWRLSELHNQTGLPKSTLSRILSTLEQEGYVSSDPKTGLYHLTSAIKTLSSGYRETIALVDVGADIAIRVTGQIKWPLAIGLPRETEIAIYFSTMSYSPLASFTTTIGFRLNMMKTAMGQAYLAFSTPVERSVMINLLIPSSAEDTQVQRRSLMKQLEKVAQDGYAARYPSVENETATLAVPIIVDGSALGSLGMTTFGKALTNDVISEHVPILRATAKEMSAAYLAKGS